MNHIFSELDTLIALPYNAFEKKLTKLEEEFRAISISDVVEEELESYFLRIRSEYSQATGDAAKTRLSLLAYISHFDELVEKFFPEYVHVFQETLDRPDQEDLWPMNYILLEHIEDILRDYTHRLSDPDQYPSYTGYIQELIQNSMIDLFFWLQEREQEAESNAGENDKNTALLIRSSQDTKTPKLRYIRECLELLH